ncbi:hypothetical protein EYW49_22355 [Siculibacillus lacustris]|uniref:Uncharacterized protein n=1 Tax=Siculibacillus lacustris TaxID=1549641 RepID=A0A4Q9VE90_9HYPH|nr:hypothetical protein [Siculibacillus lacustris]TBW32257.1 hypothetical protein EYW49_22355 [Siculibacillus lacustris]
MERSFILDRKVLLNIEARPSGVYISDLESNISSAEISECVRRLHLAGLIYSKDEITAAGREFLDAVRDENRWKRIESALSLARGWTYSLVHDFALHIFENASDTNGGSPDYQRRAG